jgi:hypothetical protein
MAAAASDGRKSHCIPLKRNSTRPTEAAAPPETIQKRRPSSPHVRPEESLELLVSVSRIGLVFIRTRKCR